MQPPAQSKVFQYMRYFLFSFALLLTLTTYGDSIAINPVSSGQPHKDLKLSTTFKKKESVTFTLRNNRPVSIPLIIPGVMNPNLSPFSRSGVQLVYGQEILFKEKGKRYILLVVDEQIAEGDVIDVGQLLKKRRKEEGLR